jgi:hypothetical protein
MGKIPQRVAQITQRVEQITRHAAAGPRRMAMLYGAASF